MKTVVIYKSKSGYTKTYADWIAQELSCDKKENSRLKPEDLAQYDTVIYGGGMYAGRINGLSLLTRNPDVFSGRNIIVWATGANPGRPEEMEAVWERNFPGESRKKVKTFYLRGGFDFSRLGKMDRIVMRLLKRKLEKEKDLSEDMQGMLRGYEEPFDFCNRGNIRELVEYVRGLEKADGLPQRNAEQE